MSLLPSPPTTRTLGKSGIAVSSLAWGMWRFSGQSLEAATRLVHSVLDAGITLFDTADIYGFDGSGGFGDAEVLFGEVMAADRSIREQIVLATKGGIMPPLPYDQSATYLSGAIDASLKRLGVERVELYQIHRPDILTHPQEVARTLADAVAAGKIASVGVSNMTIAQIAALQTFLGDIAIVATQPEISPVRIDCFENGEMDQAMMQGLTPLAWSPLGGGRLAAPTTERERAVVAALEGEVERQNAPLAAVAYSWLMAHPAGIIPIIGTQRPERIAEAVEAYKVRWTRESWYAVLVAARGVPLP
ncbi:aldo/keto reductase [Sphingomonas lacunae]|uniref:Aldo/keto reductase n=1 Tax=Sphingomonas lacunae TaxID=2698828 RepID=A0A6M4ATV1_9SPHN|nr:aldo/keto reductase [Sphingomonas lacunae]QJQ31762.1 aldo/keto reductase [Sphingomonas lacunae]